MAPQQHLKPAGELAETNRARFPNESGQYRAARNALLIEEIELRRHIERVAALRRALPPGGLVSKDYQFVGEQGPVAFSELFGDKQTLAIYSYMYGPKRRLPCPMCTSLLSSWDGVAADVEQRIALAVVARSPIDRQAKIHAAPLISCQSGRSLITHPTGEARTGIRNLNTHRATAIAEARA
jgi:predicted dithiol-disulfide oxidoreductase (DUF899 family)